MPGHAVGSAVPPRSALISREIEMTRLHQTVHSKLGVCSDTRAEVIGSTGFFSDQGRITAPKLFRNMTQIGVAHVSIWGTHPLIFCRPCFRH